MNSFAVLLIVTAIHASTSSASPPGKEEGVPGCDNDHICGLDDAVGGSLSLLQVGARAVRSAGPSPTWQELSESELVQETCGKTSPLQRNPETALLIPQTITDEYELLQVQTITRHGAPMESWEVTCPNWFVGNTGATWNCSMLPPQDEDFAGTMNVNPGNCEIGTLLDWGFEQHVRNGKALRSAYVDSGLLGKCPHVYSYADNGANGTYIRTGQSRVALLSGMFQDDGYVHAQQTSDYDMFYTDRKGVESGSWGLPPAMHEEVRAVYDKLGLVQGRNWMKCLNQGICNEKGTPMSVDAYLAAMNKVHGELKDFYFSRLHSAPHNPTFSTMEIPELALNMLAQLDSLKSKEASQFVLWSAHDLVLFPLAVSLGYDNFVWPPYAAVFSIEIWRHKLDGKDYTRVLYRGEDVTDQSAACSEGLTAEGLCPLQAIRDKLQETVDVAREAGLNLKLPRSINFSNKQCKTWNPSKI